ncbi:MAG: PorT family protein [Flavobacteriaceae bacterium]|nr:PorT family protein [Flavobacteriaceae bacterium]
MKKFLLLAVVFVVSNVVFAQEVTFGAKVGVNYGATLTSDADYNALFKGAIRPQFGVFAELNLSDAFALQGGLEYFGSGFQGKGEDVDYKPLGSTVELQVKNEVKGKLAYLQVPVLAKYYITEGFSVEAGPYVGFLLSAKYDGKSTTSYNGSVLGTTDYDNEDLKDEYNSTDFGLKFGVGYKLENGLMFSAGYNLGLSDLQKEDEGEVSGDDGVKGTESFKVKNQFFQFGVGYKFL